MSAADPVDDQNDLSRLLIDIGDHLMDYGSDDTLLQPRISRGGGPDGLEVCSEHGKRCRIGDGRGLLGFMDDDLAFDLRHARERRVPARLQFAGHQPVGWVGGVVLPEGAIGCIARCLEIALECFAYLIPQLVGFFLGSYSSRNTVRLVDRLWCFGKTPMQTFLDALPLAKEKIMAA